MREPRMKNTVLCCALLAALAIQPALASDEDDDKKLREELEEARRELNEAARRVGELTRELGEGFAFRIEEMRRDMPRRAMLGIAIGEVEVSDDGEQQSGLRVMSVTPGGPAAEAGLKTGDILLAIDDVELEGEDDASRRLTEYLGSLEPGAEVEVEYRRGDAEDSVEITTEALAPRAFAFRFGPEGAEREFEVRMPRAPRMPDMPDMPDVPAPPVFFDMFAGWGDIELVRVDEQLGSYFGVDDGLLVVRAGERDGQALRGGDVILEIGGRKPKDVGQALRILRSYSAGETVEIEIVRKGDRQTIELSIPKRDLGLRWRDRDAEVVIERDFVTGEEVASPE